MCTFSPLPMYQEMLVEHVDKKPKFNHRFHLFIVSLFLVKPTYHLKNQYQLNKFEF